MSEWKEFLITEVADVIMGQSPSSSSYNEEGFGSPFLQGCADFGKRIPLKKYYCTDPKKLAPEGSILISVRAPVGSTNRADSEYCIGRGLAGIVGRSVVQDFLDYEVIFRVRDLERVSQGSTFLAINTNDLNSLKINIPTSIAEQRKIARILSNIDAVIEKTEAAIAKYKAIKQGMMADLFTRGIDLATGKLRPRYEDAPEMYKPTELGWVPKEWGILLLDDLTIRGSGHTPNKHFPEYWNGGVKWVSLSDTYKLDKVFIYETDKEISELGIANSSAVKHQAGTVILSRDAGIGKSAVLAETMAVSQHFIAWKCLGDLHNLFLYYWLQYSKPVFENIAIGSTIKTIGLPFFKSLKIPIPILSEQKKIAKVLIEIEELDSKYQKELLKNQYLKQALMSDLLTGKVRVKYEEEIPEAVYG